MPQWWCLERLCSNRAGRPLRCVTTECGQRCGEGRSECGGDHDIGERSKFTANQERPAREYHHVEDEERDSYDCCLAKPSGPATYQPSAPGDREDSHRKDEQYREIDFLGPRDE